LNSAETQEAIAFFDQYRRDFDRSDWKAFRAHFHEPFVTVRGDGSVHFLPSHIEIEEFFQTVANNWRREGYNRFSTSNYAVVPLGKFSLLASFDWEMLREDGSLIRKWRQSYQLVSIERQRRVLASTFHAT
jgi:hypothetical protein